MAIHSRCSEELPILYNPGVGHVNLRNSRTSSDEIENLLKIAGRNLLFQIASDKAKYHMMSEIWKEK